jgi:hypothetical protein
VPNISFSNSSNKSDQLTEYIIFLFLEKESFFSSNRDGFKFFRGGCLKLAYFVSLSLMFFSKSLLAYSDQTSLKVSSETYKIEATQQGSNLVLRILEIGDVEQACDLIVEKMEYFEDLNLLDVRLAAKSFCPADVVGPRQAELSWRLPVPLRSSSLTLVRVNGRLTAQVSIRNSILTIINGGVR